LQGRKHGEVNAARIRLAAPVLVALLGLLVAACGGGGGSGDGGATPPPPKNASPGGIWKGTTSGGQSILGLVTETGEFYFLQSDGAQYYCFVSVSGNSVSSGFTGITQVGTTFPNGSTRGSGTLTATLAERSSLNGSLVFTLEAAPSGALMVASLGSVASTAPPCGSMAAALLRVPFRAPSALWQSSWRSSINGFAVTQRARSNGPCHR
jgi:hypothetical protein